MNEQLPNVGFNLGTLDETKFGDKAESLPKGTSYFRVLPPFGTKHNGALFHHYRLHWGFVGPKGNKIPISCSMQSEGYCPVCSRVYEAMDEQKRAEVNNNEKLAKDLGIYIKEHGVRKTYIYNMASLDGTVKMIGLSKSAHDALIAKIGEAVYKKKFDPTALEGGVWFEFNRTGEGLKTEYAVDFKRKSDTVNGEIVEKLDTSPLAKELIDAVRAQLGGAKAGPLKDIHVSHEITTSEELRGLMSGGTIQRKKSAAQAEAPAVATTEAAPAAETTTAEAPKATDVSAATQANLAAEISRLRALQAKATTKEA